MAIEIEFITSSIPDLLADLQELERLTISLKKGTVIVLKEYSKSDLIQKIQTYLMSIGRGSLANYQSIEEGCSNFHRINRTDERSYVKGCFHQFVFFPWNQDLFDFFDIFGNVYRLRNRLSSLNENEFLGRKPDQDCIARLAFQFYPKGMGNLNRHSDPVDYHQLTVPILLMSKKGIDFHKGGLFVEDPKGEKIFLDEVGDPGDVIFFNANMVHGVDLIDPDEKTDWLEFQGRWMLLFAVNRLNSNQKIGNAQDLGF
jgi:hypothetical protein